MDLCERSFRSQRGGLILKNSVADRKTIKVITVKDPYNQTNNAISDSIFVKQNDKSAINNSHANIEDPSILIRENNEMKSEFTYLENEFNDIVKLLHDSQLNIAKLNAIFGVVDKKYTKLKDDRRSKIFEYERQIAVLKKKKALQPSNGVSLIEQHKRRCIELRNGYRIAVFNNGGEELPDEEDVIDSIGSIKDLSLNERKPGLECPNCNIWWDVDENDKFQNHVYNCF